MDTITQIRVEAGWVLSQASDYSPPFPLHSQYRGEKVEAVRTVLDLKWFIK